MFNPNKNKDGKLPNNETSKFKVGTGDGDFLKLYQDPTVLGFKLFFINIADEAVPVDENNPINTQVNTVQTTNSHGLFGNADNPNSALYYLNKMGDQARFDMLVDFKKLLSSINTNYPWYFQSIEGLNEAWNRDYNAPKFKKEITIGCLESIDLRITGLMDLYRKIAYDWTNRRAILPDNLRQFELSIKVFDIRNFQKDPGKYLTKEGEDSDSRNVDKTKQNTAFHGEDWSVTNQITFNLSHCEFMPDESGNMLSSISNSSYEQATQSIKFSYQNIQEDNIYRSLIALGRGSHYYVRDYLRKELTFLQGGEDVDANDSFKDFGIPSIEGANNPNFQQKLSQIAKNTSNSIKNIDIGAEMENVYSDLQSNITSAAADVVTSKLKSLYLGNVYGFSPSTFVQTFDPVSAASAPIENAVSNKTRQALGNVFGN